MSTRIAVHPNSPARVDGALNSSTATTAAFDAPADTLLVACVVANSSTGGTTTAVMSNNGAALTWTLRVVTDYPAYGLSGYAAIYTAPVGGSARTGLTVTVTTAGSTSTTRRPSLQVFVLTGANNAEPVAGGRRYSSTRNALECNGYQGGHDSLTVVAASDWRKRGAPTSRAMGAGFDQAGAGGVSGLVGTLQGGPGLDFFRFDLDGAGDAACEWNVARLDVAADLTESPAGMAPLPAQLPDTYLQVQAAWSADLSDFQGITWEWTDITADVRQQPGVSVQLGRGDEAAASQPASLTCTLDNVAGAYSAGPLGLNYPNVRVGVPIRARLFVAGSQVATTLFQGFAAGWAPGWDLSGRVRTVQLEASGILRRLQQGSAPVQSALRRSLADNGKTIAYWPCEDGKLATILAPAVGTVGMRYGGPPPKLASVDAAECSAPIIDLNGASLAADLPVYPASAKNQVRALFVFPDDDVAADGVALLSIYTSGSIARWDVQYRTGGGFSLATFDRFGASISASVTWAFGVNGETRLYDVTLVQNGADVDWTVGTLRPYSQLGQASGTIASHTVGNVVKVEVNRTASVGNLGVGHIAVMNDDVARLEPQEAVDAWAGDRSYASTRARLWRIGRENGLLVQYPRYVEGAAETPVDRMGPQGIDTLSELMREVELVEGGILHDGLGPGVTYVERRAIESAPAMLTIDASADQMSPPFGLTDDDQRTRNTVIVTRTGGSSATVEDATGPLGTSRVGVYDESVTANLFTDEGAPLLAGWRVSLGTVEGYRYPRVTVDLQASPELAAAAAAVRPGDRIDVTGVDAVLPFHPAGDVRLLVEGVEHDFGAASWHVTFVCSPYLPWATGLAAGAAGAAGTVGKTSDGASSSSSSTDKLAASLFTASADGVVFAGHARAWLSAPGSAGSRLVVYADAGGAPGALLAISDEVTITQTAETLHNYTFTGASQIAVASGASYWVGLMWDDPGTPSVTFSRDNTASARVEQQGFNYPAAPDPFGTPSGALTGPLDVWVETVPAGGEFDARATDDGRSSLSAGAVAGATSLSVATATGSPLWTTQAGDFPLRVLVGGVPATVTGVSGAASPQTFAIAPLGTARAAGALVTLANPTTAGL